MHPTQDDLSGFVFGTLDDEAAERVADHIEQCEQCEQAIRAIESASDTFVDALKTPVAANPFREESECQEMLDAIRAIGQDPGPKDKSLASLGQIGQYVLLDKLGEGGMGAVYKARHTKLDKIVAIKVLPVERMKDTGAVARFEREMRAVGKLDHPNIVRAMDAGEADGTHFLVMEFVRGSDLSKLSGRCGPLPIADACELIRQAAIGLDDAHQHGMVHRDIKPSNLMLAEQNRKPPVVKILDMGLALLNESLPKENSSKTAPELTDTGQMMGTLDYMSPEQGDDSHEVDIRADVYALGASLYKLLTGHAIYCDPKYASPIRKMVALASKPAPPITEQRSEVPAELAAIVHQMLEKNRANRIATPIEVAEALEPFCEGADLQNLAEASPVVSSEVAAAEKAPASSSGIWGTGNQHGLAIPVQPKWHRPVIIALLLCLVAAITFVLPAQRGFLEIDLQPSGGHMWIISSYLMLALAGLASISLSRRQIESRAGKCLLIQQVRPHYMITGSLFQSILIFVSAHVFLVFLSSIIYNPNAMQGLIELELPASTNDWFFAVNPLFVLMLVPIYFLTWHIYRAWRWLTPFTLEIFEEGVCIGGLHFLPWSEITSHAWRGKSDWKLVFSCSEASLDRQIYHLLKGSVAIIPLDSRGAVQRLLEKNRANRIATPIEVADALEPFCEGADLQNLAEASPVVSSEVAPSAKVASSSFPGRSVEVDTASQAPNKWRRAAMIAIAFGPLVFAVALISYLQPDRGTLKIIFHDSEIDVVTIQATGTGIYDFDTGQEIRLPPGEHQLKIERAGVDFITDKFVVSPDEKIIVDVMSLEEKVKVTMNGEPIALTDTSSAPGKLELVEPLSYETWWFAPRYDLAWIIFLVATSVPVGFTCFYMKRSRSVYRGGELLLRPKLGRNWIYYLIMIVILGGIASVIGMFSLAIMHVSAITDLSSWNFRMFLQSSVATPFVIGLSHFAVFVWFRITPITLEIRENGVCVGLKFLLWNAITGYKWDGKYAWTLTFRCSNESSWSPGLVLPRQHKAVIPLDSRESVQRLLDDVDVESQFQSLGAVAKSR